MATADKKVVVLVHDYFEQAEFMQPFHALKNTDWVDETQVVDGNLITSRNPDDVPAIYSAWVGALPLV